MDRREEIGREVRRRLGGMEAAGVALITVAFDLRGRIERVGVLLEATVAVPACEGPDLSDGAKCQDMS